MTPPRVTSATIVASDRIAHARVLAASWRRHHPDIPFYVLLADEHGGRLDPATEPFVLVGLDDIGLDGDAPLRFRYDKQALSFALTPAFLLHLLDEGYDQVVFLKQETLVLERLDPVLERLQGATAVLTPHLLEPAGAEEELAILLAGTFNAGVVGVSDSEAGRALLAWWDDRLREHCVHDVASGLHYEQRWLDLVPALFPDVAILRDPTVNVGHWNLSERAIEIRDGVVLARGSPCRLFRFSGYRPEHPEQVTQYDTGRTVDEIGAAADVFAAYREKLIEAGHEACSRWPYACGNFDNGVPVPTIARDLYRGLGERALRFGDPFATAGDSFFGWLMDALWPAVWDRRPDLRAAFPDPDGRDRSSYATWVREHGADEFEIPSALVPPETLS